MTRGPYRPGDLVDPTRLTTGQETIPRINVNAASFAPASQSLRLHYFLANKTFTAAQIRIYSGTIAAGATPTLVRFGLYSVAANGDISLIASTPNDTTLLASASTAYTKAFSATTTVTAGSWYAVGTLVVSAAAMPSYLSAMNTAVFDQHLAPRLTGSVAAQADLPSSVVTGSIGTSSGAIYSVILP